MQRAQVWHAMGPMSLACDPELEIVATLIVGKGKINHEILGSQILEQTMFAEKSQPLRYLEGARWDANTNCLEAGTSCG